MIAGFADAKAWRKHASFHSTAASSFLTAPNRKAKQRGRRHRTANTTEVSFSGHEGGGANPVNGTGYAHRAKVILGRRFREPLSIAQLAAEVGCSAYYLCRVFRKCFGITVHRYRNQLRLRAALQLLASADVDLTEIALAVGYSSHSHFTSEFRRAFGCVPSAVRKLCARGSYSAPARVSRGGRSVSGRGNEASCQPPIRRRA
jgi:AraC-like DNA-binding protein